MKRSILLSLVAFAAAAPALAQGNAPQPAAEIEGVFEDKPAPPTGARRALIVCGLAGDVPHHEGFSRLVVQLHKALTERLGFAPADVTVLFGDEPDDKDPELIRHSHRSTREELQAAAAALCESSRAEDAAWVIVLGHAHYDSRQSWLNLPGPDVAQQEFAALFKNLAGRQQVFVIATPASGQYIKPLSQPGRVVITATEPDWETNETEFPFELAKVLDAPPEAEALDIDQDGAVTLFDVYLATARNLAQSYLDRELLATEHPLLDDNGDGRGTELQVDYLTAEQGGRLRPGRSARPGVPPNTDGYVAKTIRIDQRGLRR